MGGDIPATLAGLGGASHLFAPYYRNAAALVARRLSLLRAPPGELCGMVVAYPTADALLFTAELELRLNGRSLRPVALGEVRSPLFLYVALLVLFREAWDRLDYGFAEGF